MDPILTSDLLIEAGDDYVLRPAPASYAVAILSFLALFVDVPCIAWHIKNRNFSAISLVFWIMLGNLFNFVNAIVWANDDVDHWFQGQVYCDVEVKLDLGATIGITGALLCLMRSLARALDTDKPAILQNKPHGQRKLIVEGILCFGLPVYLMAIHYVVQPNRYYIFGIAGCTVSFDRSWPAIVLVFIWPVLICLMDSYYCALIIIRLHKYRRNFASVLRSTSSGLTKARFLRLFFASAILLLVFLPVQIYVLYVNTAVPLLPYDWNAVHDPTYWPYPILQPANGTVLFDRWIRIALAFTVFGCFGLGVEAQNMYRSWATSAGLGKLMSRRSTQLSASLSQGSERKQVVKSIDSTTELDGTFLTTSPVTENQYV